jgi:hypothetical protein
MLINIFVRNSDSSSNDYGAAELGTFEFIAATNGIEESTI